MINQEKLNSYLIRQNQLADYGLLNMIGFRMNSNTLTARQSIGLYDLRNDCDDILIVKRGMVTDSSYANIVFRRGKRWYTPWSALLKGTMRLNLLERNKIYEEEIRVEDLRIF